MYKSHLAQALATKSQLDEDLWELSRCGAWYSIDHAKLAGGATGLLGLTFESMQPDSETVHFLDECQDASDSLVLQLYYTLATYLLKAFISKTSINGLLRRGSMFLFSTTQLATFLRLSAGDSQTDSTPTVTGKAVLDLGAGDGAITAKFESFYNPIYATETSGPMRSRLMERGYQVMDVDHWFVWNNTENELSLVSCLNLLDRHPAPRELLAQLHSMSANHNCPVLLAVVLPWTQYVEFGADNSENAPTDLVTLSGGSFEAQLDSLMEKLIRPAKFRLIRWTKLPYLCEGDSFQAFYWLQDAVLLLEAEL